MNKNLLKVLLLSTLTVSLVACGTESSTPTDSPVPSETPSETSSSVILESSSESESSGPVVDEHPAIIELSRKIFIEGEDIKPYVTRFDMWSDVLEDYKPKLENFRVVMPETCPNGPATVTLITGRDRAEVEIMYYDSIETAVAKTEITMPSDKELEKIFDEEAYIKDDKLQFSAYEADGVLYAQNVSLKILQPNRITSVTWATQDITLWNDPTKLVAGVYDSTKLTVPHYVNGDKNEYHCTYAPKLEEGQITSVDSIVSYEIITDAAGNILYFAPISYSSAKVNLATGEGYWSQIKDYKSNPVFTFAPDFDEVTNPNAYQKVLPEGGTWIIGTNNRGPAHYIDKLWNSISGLDGTLIIAYAPLFTVTLENVDIEASLMNARVKAGKDGRYTAAISYSVANTYQRYAYYASLAAESGDADKIAYRAPIKEAIIMQQIPEVKNEPILFAYYEGITSDKLDEWAALFSK